MLRFVFLLIAFTFILLVETEAQPYCPPTLNDPPTWSETLTAGFLFSPPSNFGGEVDFVYRQNNGVYEVKTDWSTFENYHKYGISDDEMKQMMYKAIMFDILGMGCHLQGTIDFIFYEETECKVLRHCYLHLIKTQEVYCQDEGWPGPNPSYYEYNNEKYYKLSEYQVCGTQCCKLIFTIQCYDNRIQILNMVKSPYPGSQCPAGNYIDCLTNDPESCVSTCD